MNKYREIFGTTKTLLAVIHCEGPDHTYRNAKIAKDNGAHGIFLINHSFHAKSEQRSKDLMSWYRLVREQFPDYWIGVNLLGVPLEEISDYVTRSVNGIWTDRSGVPNAQWKAEHPNQTCAAKNFLAEQKDWPGIYFGGTAFKYTGLEHDDPATAALEAMPYMDVITTSGDGTGSAPMTQKLKAMREAIGDFPLANASGNSIDNAPQFCEYVDCLITASSLLRTDLPGSGPDEFDAGKIYELSRLLETFNN